MLLIVCIRMNQNIRIRTVKNQSNTVSIAKHKSIANFFSNIKVLQ